MKALLVGTLLLSVSAFAADPTPYLKIDGIGSNCEEAKEDLVRKLNNIDAAILDVSMEDCQHPNDFNKVEIPAEVLLGMPQA